MGINVWTKMGFENRNSKGGAMQNFAHNSDVEDENSSENSSVITYSESENLIANSGSYYYYANQILLNKSLKETLNYIQAHAYDKRKHYVLGELWDSLGNYDDDDSYRGELVDFELDGSLENIFAA